MPESVEDFSFSLQLVPVGVPTLLTVLARGADTADLHVADEEGRGAETSHLAGPCFTTELINNIWPGSSERHGGLVSTVLIPAGTFNIIMSS